MSEVQWSETEVMLRTELIIWFRLNPCSDDQHNNLCNDKILSMSQDTSYMENTLHFLGWEGTKF